MCPCGNVPADAASIGPVHQASLSGWRVAEGAGDDIGAAAAASKNATASQIALAWVMSRDAAIVPLIGAHGWKDLPLR